MREKAILEIRNLVLRMSGRSILDDLSMGFARHRVHAVIGPNGAGKSTLACAIMGLSDYRRYEGSILFKGEPVDELPVDQRARRGMTMAWQEPARYEGLSVERFILSGAAKKSKETVREVLEQVGLDPARYGGRAVDKTLSGGERKRVELASILAMRPLLVIMDEPDSGIDMDALARIFDALEFLKANGSTVLLITHSVAVLERADHGFLMCDGKLICEGGVEKIRRYYANKCMPCDHPNEPHSDFGERAGDE